MANLVLCGWEWGTIREASQWRYSVSESSIVTTTRRTGAYAVHIGDYDHIYFAFPYEGTHGVQDVYIQFAVNFDPLLGLGGLFFSWNGKQGGRELGHLEVGTNGQVLVYSGCSGSVDAIAHPAAADILRIASKTRIISNTWYVFELRAKIDHTDGQLELKIDGNSEGVFFGETANSDWDDLWMTDTLDFSYFSGAYYDDIVVNDSTGTTNNSWPNCQKVVLLRPKANAEVIEWSRTNDYDNYEHVNDVPPNATDYVFTPVIEQTDIYEVDILPDEAYTIATVRSDAWALKNSSADQNSCLAFALKNGLTTTSPIYASDTVNLALTWQLKSYVWSLINPDTVSPWTVDDINIIRSGIISK